MSERFAIGLDLGGTHLRAGLVHQDGTVEGFRSVPSRARESADAPLEAMVSVVEELQMQARRSIIGVGLGAPGTIDPFSGSLVGTTPHLPYWEDFPLRRRLAERLDVPLQVDNDANLAALGEHRAGAARGARLSITVMVGTGVGCGIVDNGHLLRGAWGGAGEVGHLPLGDGRLECRCGIEGCAEPEMSGSGLSRQAAALGLDWDAATELFDAAAAGDRAARELVDRFGDRLGASIASAVNLLNPDVVVIGGGVAEAGEALLGRVRAALDRYALESHRRRLKVLGGKLGSRAGVVGAGFLVWDARRTSTAARAGAITDRSS